MFLPAIILAEIGVAWLFIRYLIQRDRGHKEPTGGLIIAGLFGLFAVWLAIYLEQWFLPAGIDDPASPIHTLAWGALMVGIIEEGAKLLPLAIWIYRKPFFNEVTDGIIYFGISGMVFGVVETIMYSLMYGSGTGISRLITIPFLHAGFCVCFGWLLARKKVMHTSWWAVAAGLAAAIGLHAAYDLGLFYGAWWSIIISMALTIGCNVLVFYLYGRAERRDRKLGLSASHRHNWFCPYCGTPNPHRYLHCGKCGRIT